jgi:XTP/dITP diphosphohydrolase
VTRESSPGSPAPWVLATRSAGKLRELRPLFRDAGIEVIDLVEAGIPESSLEESIESHATFEENARAKAQYFYGLCGGLDVVADDSGLCVDALGGEPGVRSKRWSGAVGTAREIDAANNAKLVSSLAGVSKRGAQFVCAAAWRGPGGELVATGAVAGTILEAPSGTHGFGYDPYFHSPELGMTLGEAATEQKRLVSHRGRAFDALLAALRARGPVR